MAEEIKTYKLNERSIRTLAAANDAVKAAEGRRLALIQGFFDSMEIPEGYLFDPAKMEFVKQEIPEAPKP